MKYHITSVENAEKILKEGLKANSGIVNSGLSEPGYIYLFDDECYKHPFIHKMIEVKNDIALNQLLMCPGEKYALLEIDEAGLRELEKDEVGEFCSHLGFLWKVKQDVIESKYIESCGYYEVYNPWKEFYNN